MGGQPGALWFSPAPSPASPLVPSAPPPGAVLEEVRRSGAGGWRGGGLACHGTGGLDGGGCSSSLSEGPSSPAAEGIANGGAAAQGGPAGGAAHRLGGRGGGRLNLSLLLWPVRSGGWTPVPLSRLCG